MKPYFIMLVGIRDLGSQENFIFPIRIECKLYKINE